MEFQFTGASGVRTKDLHEYTGVFFKDITSIGEDYTIETINWSLPTQPSDGDVKSKIYEPALYMQPFYSRKILRGDGEVVLEIPDLDIEAKDIKLRQVITSAGITNIFIHDSGNSDIENIANGEMGIDNSVILDVVNDQWKEYVYTKRDTDRQMTSNYAWKNAIDNLIYMSYGGALVGSRSMGNEGLYNPASKEWVQNRNNGQFASGGHWETKGAGLTAAGKRVLGAVGLSGAASIVTSLVDAHFAWENQLQKEKQIRNEPTTASIIGDGIATVLNGLRDYYVVEQRVDDVNYDRAFENFWKYGYWINKFEKPDISSRKYFNYILTNGAIVNGSINQSIRDVIASIFDAGVTIFHYDSGDSATRNLEYTDKENIEVSLLGPQPTPDTQYYTVPNVTENHTIHAEFRLNE